eukprot:349912-Chlamydomonas_euryale.AAC.4
MPPPLQRPCHSIARAGHHPWGLARVAPTWASDLRNWRPRAAAAASGWLKSPCRASAPSRSSPKCTRGATA